jgi:hypothetical protein
LLGLGLLVAAYRRRFRRVNHNSALSSNSETISEKGSVLLRR